MLLASVSTPHRAYLQRRDTSPDNTPSDLSDARGYITRIHPVSNTSPIRYYEVYRRTLVAP